MKGYVLAGGRGKRFEPFTKENNKVMMDFWERPLLWYSLNLLQSHGVKEVAINAAHMPEQIDKYVNYELHSELNINLTLESEHYGTAGTIKRTPSFFNDHVALIPGDVITTIDLSEMYNNHYNNDAIVTLALHPNYLAKNKTRPQVNKITDSDMFHCFRKKMSGVMIVRQDILDLIPKKTNMNLLDELLPMMLDYKIQINAFSSKSGFYNIDDWSDYYKATLDMFNHPELHDRSKIVKMNNNIYHHVNAKFSKQVLKNDFQRLYFGENVSVENKCKLKGDVYIGSFSKLNEDARLTDSVVGSNTILGKGLNLNNDLVKDKYLYSNKNEVAVYVDDENLLKENDSKTFGESLNELLISFTDKFVAAVALLCLSPLFALVALLIKLESPGPVFYVSSRVLSPRHERKGKKWYQFKGGSNIKYYVFRTMYVNADKMVKKLNNKYETGPFVKIENDPRVTKIGRLLRKTSIDELPLFWNVLVGKMSLVGIWALPTYEAEHLANKGLQSTVNNSRQIDLSETARLRFDGKLGLAGFWQSRGRSNLTAEERAIHDSFQAVLTNQKSSDAKFMGEYYKFKSYVGYWRILIETFFSVVKRTGAI